MFDLVANVPAGSRGAGAFSQMAPWLVGLTVLAIVGGVVIMVTRRWARAEEDPLEEGFTLRDLRAMHARGELTDEELQRAERKMISRVRATAVGAAEDEALALRERLRAARSGDVASPDASPRREGGDESRPDPAD